jgi:hypothetical protein
LKTWTLTLFKWIELINFRFLLVSPDIPEHFGVMNDLEARCREISMSFTVPPPPTRPVLVLREFNDVVTGRSMTKSPIHSNRINLMRRLKQESTTVLGQSTDRGKTAQNITPLKSTRGEPPMRMYRQQRSKQIRSSINKSLAENSVRSSGLHLSIPDFQKLEVDRLSTNPGSVPHRYDTEST